MRFPAKGVCADADGGCAADDCGSFEESTAVHVIADIDTAGGGVFTMNARDRIICLGILSFERMSLTSGELLDKLSDMKQINAREFQKSFGRITGKLRAGESLEITKHGKVVGTFTKQRKKVNWDKILKFMEQKSCPPEVGDEMVRKYFNDSLS